ncbi:hypothetical protein B0T09DRAFT_113548 [Sordaria sp. MPI-SDFR-AT-0083]|nr:hypothetical protein B0T09DRAFT_113548 [Sordaria sp. MPI-SDFR-AT-0083]
MIFSIRSSPHCLLSLLSLPSTPFDRTGSSSHKLPTHFSQPHITCHPLSPSSIIIVVYLPWQSQLSLHQFHPISLASIGGPRYLHPGMFPSFPSFPINRPADSKSSSGPLIKLFPHRTRFPVPGSSLRSRLPFPLLLPVQPQSTTGPPGSLAPQNNRTSLFRFPILRPCPLPSSTLPTEKKSFGNSIIRCKTKTTNTVWSKEEKSGYSSSPVTCFGDNNRERGRGGAEGVR